jgi:TRAP-type C4-dicarboxylate transport system permease small subunit
MDRERLARRILQGIIAIFVAAIASAFYTFQAMWCSNLLFNHWYPHDGQNALGVLMIGIVALPLSFGACFWMAMVFQKNLENRRRERDLRLTKEQRFTITGEPSA